MTGLLLISAAKSRWLLLRSTLVSFAVVMLSHLALFMVSLLLPSDSVLVMLLIAGFVLFSTHVLTGWLRRILGLPASAPAMVVCHILFLWVVHTAVIRKVISNFLDASLNVECLLLFFGFYGIVSSDPGLVSIGSTYYGVVAGPEPVSYELPCSGALRQPDISNFDFSNKRIRSCSCCKRSVKGFDHHCPAFGNCIGQKNHHLFMFLVIFFIITEGTYTICARKYIKVTSGADRVKFEKIIPGNLVVSTLLFSFLQVFWQVPFLIWHIYCICFNIRTDEWINWRKYPEFQIAVQPQQVSRSTEARFVNPYSNGILRNIKDYLAPSLCSEHSTL